jgi:hypothetical protein
MIQMLKSLYKADAFLCCYRANKKHTQYKRKTPVTHFSTSPVHRQQAAGSYQDSVQSEKAWTKTYTPSQNGPPAASSRFPVTIAL